MTSARPLKAILGPTNTGKTWFAIERMLAHPTGMIGLPLRLLAREVYQKVRDRVGEGAVALVTGEERIVPPKPRYWVATVEAMPDVAVDMIAIDEVQTAISFDRGHVFTNRILHARGRHETLLLGAETMVNTIRALLPDAEIIHRPRLSQLNYAGSRKISRQPERSAIVAFSASQVYAIAELLRRERGGAAVVMGALSPRTRNAQVELYQSGEVDFLVATDAIGMGLNLDVHHVAFADDTKFDGHQTRPLTPAEFAQIAGRAGRHLRNGTFGVTAGVEEFEPELIEQLEAHDFEPIRILQWRSTELDFASIDALRQSLEAPPPHRTLTRVPTTTDQYALDFLSRNEAGRLATSREAVELLWECCQIPDYRDISPAQHGEIITRIYSDLRTRGSLDPDWIAEQVRFCDNISGDIDTLSNRIRQIRTWTFVANRRNWLEDPAHWREKTRAIEDRLSDALHERLTQRFVDRRTGVLMRHLRDRRMAEPEINERGEISLEGHRIGTIEGFRFTLERSDEGDAKNLRGAAAQVVAPEIHRRAERVAGAPNEELLLATDGFIRWRGEVVAMLAEGDSIYAPRILVLSDDSLSGPDLERVQDRLNLWLRHAINTQLEPVISLSEPQGIDGAARGLAYRLYENLGILPRSAVADEVKGLDQDVRAVLRKLGIKFGAYHIYVPMSLKPAPRELAIMLHALKNGGLRQPGVSELPQIVLSGRTSITRDPEIAPALYEIAGFKVAGKRAVRVDILERLADIIRPLIAIDPERFQGTPPAGAAKGNGFRVTVEMTSLLGCSGEEFASVLTALGYRVQRTPKPVEAVAAPRPAADDAAPVSEDVQTTPTHEASVDAEAASAVEGNDLPAGEVAPQPTELVEAAADLGNGPLPEASETDTTAEAAAAAEPQFDEVWFPGGRRSEDRVHHNRRPNRATREPAAPASGDAQPAQATAGERPARQDRAQRPDRAERPDRKDRPERGPRPPRRDDERSGGPRPEGRQDRRGPQGDNRGPRTQSFPEGRGRREQAFDPDSPFAALAALRNPKPE